MTQEAHTIGRAKTVLVFGGPDSQKAVISAILARQLEAPGKNRLRFAGAVKFSRSVKSHFRQTILPIIDKVLGGLGQGKKHFEISAVNLGAASSMDVGTSIRGYSADAPLFLAMLSGALGIPLPDDCVCTGHIASVEGDIGPIRALPAKLEAAQSSRDIKRFIYPDLEDDSSLKTLSPVERRCGLDAIMAARDTVDTRAVKGIGELVRTVFAEQDIVLASLREGFFNIPGSHNNASGNPILDTVGFLTKDNARRFWDILHRSLQTGDCWVGKSLLRAFVRFSVKRKAYPANTGTRLLQLVCSLPPAVRRLKKVFPILDTELCIRLSQYAGKPDYPDVLNLLDAAHGRHLSQPTQDCIPAPLETNETNADCCLFDSVTSQISEHAIAREIDVPIDSARASYVLDSSKVDTEEEVLDTLESFFIHLQRHTASAVVESVDEMKARSEAIALLQRTFRGRGGDRAALTRAQNGTQGGIRSFLDILTERYKAEKKAAYIQRVFKEAIDIMQWDQQVSFMRGAMMRLGPLLPAELRHIQPERLIGSYQTIIQAYVESLDRVSRLVGTM